MKRTFISFMVIILFIITVVSADVYVITDFASEMTDRLDMISSTEDFQEQKALAEELDSVYESRRFWLHRFIPTGKLEDIETLLHKLNAYLKEEDEKEIEATAAEIRARVNFLYSTWLYHWYHPFRFRIE